MTSSENLPERFENLVPVEAVALQIARTDLHYVTACYLGLDASASAAELALIQYGLMASYEAQVHFKKTLGIELHADWPADVAKAARMSGKFFDDSKRNFEGVVDHFEELTAANRGAFFPVDRRGRIFDFLRDDLSVTYRNNVPYTANISAFFLTGLAPADTSTIGDVGPKVRQLAIGLGNIAAQLLLDSGQPVHGTPPVTGLEVFDAKSRKALPRLFAAQHPPALSVALLTIQGMLASARASSSRATCSWCEQAAAKHRFVALFQTLKALSIMRSTESSRSSPRQLNLILDEPESQWVLDNAKLRNGLIHLGLQDIALRLDHASTIDEVILAYSGESAEAVNARVARHLETVFQMLTSWATAAPSSKRSFRDALHPAPAN